MKGNPTGSGTDSTGFSSIYLADIQIDTSADIELRALLSACFTGPEHARFSTQRYYYFSYPHRWILRAADGQLAAHAGIHELELRCGAARFSCGGIADACVHPDFQGRGLLKKLLGDLHAWLRGRACAFSVLFGSEPVYRSSGYRPVCVYLEHPPADLPQPLIALAAQLGSTKWPDGPATLNSGLF